jgi:uncharacterized protein (DUF885 family)
MRGLWLAGVMLALAACGPEKPAAPSAEEIAAESAKLAQYLDQEFEEELMMSPERLTALGRKELYDQLNDRSEAGADRVLAWRRESVAEMNKTIDYVKLDEAAQMSANIWAMELDRSELSNQWRRHRYVFARGGAHTDVPNFLINLHRVDEKSDLAAYVSRLRLIDTAVDQSLERAKLAAADGVRAPAFAYDETIDEARRVLTGAPFDKGPASALYADFTAKTDALVAAGKLTTEEAAAFKAEATTAMRDEMAPAYQRLITWLQEDKPNALADAKGAGALPNGADFYVAALKLNTTTDMTADQIHDFGLAEVARLRAEMETIKTQVGFTGTLDEFFQFMRTNPKFILPNTDAGRAQYIKLAEDYLAGMKAKLPEYFGLLPKANLVVKRVEAFREQPGGAQHYRRGSVDGSRPGTFYAHLSDMNAMPIFQLEAIAYHEGNPGHHLQGTIAQELTGLPKFRTQYGYTAYSEGWALYTEQLGKEMGFYTDPYSDFGRLSTEIWRAVRLVVDTGIHAKGWGEEQAVQYFLANSASAEGAVRSEIRRYIVNPGQATAYKIGMQKILDLRAEAKTTLGDKFDIRAFHDVVLGGGGVPMPILEQRVRSWIKAQQPAG